MDAPQRLYKYRSPSIQHITSLSEAKLWFSPPTQFNDPFDCAFDVLVPELSREDCETLVLRLSGGSVGKAVLDKFDEPALREYIVNGLTKAIRDALDRIGSVCCFSAVNDDLLMWGHYSQSHQGFCLEFATERDDFFQKARRVEYAGSFPALGAKEVASCDFNHLLKLVLTKAKCWDYEQEWRVLHREPGKAYSYKRESLTGVYFGAKMPESQMLMIASLLQGTNTKLYKMVLDKSSFKLHAEPITFTPIDYRKSSQAAGPA